VSTTLAIVRDEQITAITAIVPLSIAYDHRFEVSEGSYDFRAWAQANPSAAFRRFDTEDAFADAVPDVFDGTRVYTPRAADVLVAYPRNYQYGSQGLRSLDRVMREDMNTIVATLGGTSIYTDCAAILQSVTIETYEAVSILAVRFALHFTEEVAAQVSAMQNSTHQTFRVTTIASSDTLAVTIPLGMKDATYVAQAQVISTTYGGVGATPIDATKTTAGFTLQFDATLPASVTIDVEVENR